MNKIADKFRNDLEDIIIVEGTKLLDNTDYTFSLLVKGPYDIYDGERLEFRLDILPKKLDMSKYKSNYE
jgi:hypothetical protein